MRGPVFLIISGLLPVWYNSDVDETRHRIAERAGESIGARVRRRRKELGLSQVSLADAAGMNQGFISQIERGQANPRPRTMYALAVALDMPQRVPICGGSAPDPSQPSEPRDSPLFGSVTAQLFAIAFEGAP